MEKSTMLEELNQKIATNILRKPTKVIQNEESLISSGLIDSFSLVDLALLVEDSYGIRIEDYELNVETFDTLNDLVNLIIKKQSTANLSKRRDFNR